MRTLLFGSLLAMLVGCVGPAPESSTGRPLEQDPLPTPWSPTAPLPGNLRIVTFNVRNFPQVPPDPEATAMPLTHSLETDQEALVQLLAVLDFDLLALQEIREPAAFDEMLSQLSAVTGRTYASHFSENAAGNDQHVGVVVDTSTLRIEWTAEHVEVDVSGTLRPGLSARIQSTRDGGADFTVMVLHLASGDSHKRRDMRVQQATAVAGVVAGELTTTADTDYLILGDFNTAGEEEEFPTLDTAFAQGTGLLRADNATGCTSYWVKKSTNPLLRPSWIDQVYLASMQERDTTVPLVAGTHCAEHLCQNFESRDAESGGTFYGISDHCPVYFEIADADRDEPLPAPAP